MDAGWTPLSASAAHGIPLVFGDAGARWVHHAPDLVRDVAGRLGLTLGEPLEGGHLSAVCAATGPDGRALVVKASPDPDRLAHEARALRLWAVAVPHAVPALAAHGPDFLVLERIGPASAPPPTLVLGADPRAEVTLVAPFLRAVAATAAPPWAPPPYDHFARRATMAGRRLTDAATAPSPLASPARQLLAGLDDAWAALAPFLDTPTAASPPAVVPSGTSASWRLCHGDLWQGNILPAAPAQTTAPSPDALPPASPSVHWAVIDPWPHAGRVESDAARWAVSARWGADALERLHLLAQLSLATGSPTPGPSTAAPARLDPAALAAFAAFSCIDRGASRIAHLDPPDDVVALAAALAPLESWRDSRLR